MGVVAKPKDNAGIVVGMLAAAALTPFTMGASAGFMAGAMGAAITSLGARAAASLYDNKGRLDKMFKDITSSDSLKGIGKDALAGGLFAGVTQGLKIDNLKIDSLKQPLSGMDRNIRIAQQSVIRAGINSAVYGENIGSSLKTQAIAGVAAVGHATVGDIGLKSDAAKAFKPGLHAIIGAGSSAAMGADPLSGATGALVASSLSGVSAGPVELSNYAAPIAAGITIARGGCAIDMIASANVAMSVKTYNDDLHREPDKLEVKALKEKAEEAKKVREENKKYESDIVAVADKIKEIYGPEFRLSNEDSAKLHDAYLQISTQNPTLNSGDKAKLIVERYEISKLATGAVEPVYPEATLVVGKVAGWVRGAVGLARTQQVSSTAETQIVSRERFVEDVRNVIHGNSKSYVGDTHVYVIRDSKTGQLHKVGESMRGTNKFGLSKRAEEQRFRLERMTGQRFKTEIRKNFDTKLDARNHETAIIERYRRIFGTDKLPGNKGNR